MDDRLFAGYGEEIITPQIPCILTGYGYYLDRKADSVLDDLKVRAVFLQDTQGNKILIVSADLLGFSVPFSDSLRNALSIKFNICFNNIFVTCTHTHSGPASMKLRGMGEPDDKYIEFVQKKTESAVHSALSTLQKVEAVWCLREIEPIGFNRATNKLEPLDNYLGVLTFRAEKSKIYLINYACHPVTLGVNNQISADFPGRVVKTIEKAGGRCIYLQGFCGDIDPFVNKVRWGSGGVDDIDFYGRHIADRAVKLEKESTPLQNPVLSGREKRIKIPLDIKNEDAIKKEFAALQKLHKGDAGYQRFLNEWFLEAKEKLSVGVKNRYIENVPVNVISIGGLNLVGYPGEVFCEIGLKIKKYFSPAFTISNNNGNIGYIPTRERYKTSGDYGCYTAPKFYGSTFPFSSKVEEIFFKGTEELMKNGGG